MRPLVMDFTAVCLALVGLPLCCGQNAVYPSKQEHSPPVVRPSLLAIGSSVIAEQWPHTLSLVNAPVDIKALEPGPCVRFGITATGDDRDRLLQTLKFDFEIQFAGASQTFEAAGPQVVKDLKSEDFVTEALDRMLREI